MKSYNYMTCSGERIGFHVKGRVGESGGERVDQERQSQTKKVHLLGTRGYLLDSVY